MEIKAAVPFISAGVKCYLRCMFDVDGGPAEEDKFSFEVFPTAGTSNIYDHSFLRKEFFDNKLIWNKILAAKKRSYRRKKKKQIAIKSKVKKGTG